MPAASGLNSEASGIWTLRDAERLKRAGTWPSAAAIPRQISGLQLWLDAADPATLFDATSGGSLVAADGGVARWEDKSGNGRHATQATSGSRPLRKTAVQGGRDVLRFDGSNDNLSIPSSTATFKFLHASDSTILLVGKPGTTANPGVVYMFIDNQSRAFEPPGFSFFYDDRSPTFNNRPQVIAANPSENVFSNSVNDKFSPNVFSLISAVAKPFAATAGRLTMRTNGGAPYGGNTATGVASSENATADLVIGANKNNIEHLNGDIAEIIIYNSALSDADRSAIESYLMAKWGIA